MQHNCDEYQYLKFVGGKVGKCYESHVHKKLLNNKTTYHRGSLSKKSGAWFHETVCYNKKVVGVEQNNCSYGRTRSNSARMRPTPIINAVRMVNFLSASHYGNKLI